MNTEMNIVLKIIRQVKPALVELNEETILNMGVLDSLDIITVLSLLENTFRVKIPGNCLKQENFQTAHTLLGMICQIRSQEQKQGD